MTKANLAFAQFVNSIMVGERITHADAWHRATEMKPDLTTLMLALGATRDRIQFFNTQHRGQCQPTAKSAASRVEAREAFHAKVHAYMGKYSVDYDAAWAACNRQFPNEAAAMYKTTDSGATPALHSDMSGQFDTTPLANPGLLALFCLPSETAQEVFKAAYEANGKQNAVINPGKVFDGLANYFMEKKSMSHDAGIDYCKEQFPLLWAAVKNVAK